VRVVVTRPAHQLEPLATRLRELGHEPVLCPLLRIEPLGDDPIDTSGYDWLLVTSRNAAAELARRRTGRLPRVAAVGPGTAEALAERGIVPDVVASVSTQEGLAAALPPRPGRVLLVAAERARRHLVDVLAADFVPLYRTVEIVPERPPEGDVVALASASAARAFARVRRDLPAVSIGPETTAAARASGLTVVAEAATHDLAGLVSAIASLSR